MIENNLRSLINLKKFTGPMNRNKNLKNLLISRIFDSTLSEFLIVLLSATVRLLLTRPTFFSKAKNWPSELNGELKIFPSSNSLLNSRL